MKDRYFIDFETKSDLDITKVGAMKYIHTPHSDIVCMSWALNPPPYGKGEASLWLPGGRVPFHLNEECRVYSFNALFEYRVWNILGQKYNMGDLPLHIMVDVQALCARYTFPQKLDTAAKVLEVSRLKNPQGKKLMGLITQPPFKYTPEELHEFYAYCLRDTEAMIDVLNALPYDQLPEDEQAVWEETQRINIRGIPIDLPLVKRVWAVANHYRDQRVKTIPDMTGDKVRNVTQVAAVRSYCSEYGIHLDNLQKETVEDTLDRDDLPYQVRDILSLRLELARTSVAKYQKLLEQVHRGRIYDNLRYHRASTGRWGGQGFQAHNLPRATVPNVEATIRAFYDLSILEGNVMYAASALIRSCIEAPEGFEFNVIDYKAIENRVIAWVAGEEQILELHRKGLDEYIDFAAQLFGVKYNDITKLQRAMGKTVVLGAGYNLGGVGLVKYAEGYGINITTQQGQVAINEYRRTHPKIKKMWYALRDGAIKAILHPGEVQYFHEYRGTKFLCQKDRTGREWLVLTLPSHRSLFYPDPEVTEDTFGLIPTHMGLNSKNHQWQRLKLIPGRITENIVQALARDILAFAKTTLSQNGYEVILSVHDEVVIEVPDHTDQLENIEKVMCVNPPWCPDLPLDAEGVVTRRYYKI